MAPGADTPVTSRPFAHAWCRAVAVAVRATLVRGMLYLLHGFAHFLQNLRIS